MWILFEHTRPNTRSKDLLRLLISFEVPRRVGFFQSAHAAEVEDWECIIHILNKHMHYVHYHLGEDTTFRVLESIPSTFHVREVEGRAEA